MNEETKAVTTANTETGLRSLGTITNDVRLHAQMAVTGVLLMGQDFIDAKAQMKQGDWLPWLKMLGIGERTAENYMRLAREVAPDSRMARMGYTKALALLSLPEDEREDFIEENHADEKSAAEIKQLIAEKMELSKQVQEEARLRVEAQEELGRAELNQKKAKEEYDKQIQKAKIELNAVQMMNQHLQKCYDMEKSKPAQTVERTVQVEVVPQDYMEMKGRFDTLKARKEEAENAAAEMEQRAVFAEQRLRQMEIDAAERGDESGSGLTLTKFSEACNDFMAAVWTAPDMADSFCAMPRETLDIWFMKAQSIREWARRTVDALDVARASVPAEGDVRIE